MMNSKPIRVTALFLCGFALCASAQGSPIFNRNVYENTLQEASLSESSAMLASTGNPSDTGGWIEAWFLGAMPSDARTFLRAAMELAPTRFALNSDATNSFRTILRP
jgi:hypothetical protein